MRQRIIQNPVITKLHIFYPLIRVFYPLSIHPCGEKVASYTEVVNFQPKRTLMKNGFNDHPLRGFTVIELMLTIAVAAVVLSLAAPAMDQFISNSRMSGVAANMVTAINQARSEAITRGKYVSVYAASDKGMAGNATTPGIGSLANSTTAWSDGFRILQRTRGSSGALSTSASDTLLINQTHYGYKPANQTSVLVQRMTAGTNTAVETVDQFTFNRKGQLVDESTGAVISNDVQILICDGGRTGEKGRRIIINNRGNVKNYAITDSRYSNPCS